MAPTPRRSTGKAAPAKSGAASAVPKDEKLTVESDPPVAVNSPAPMEAAEAAADAEDERQAAERAAQGNATARAVVDQRERGTDDPAGPPIKGSTETPTVPAPVPVDHVINAESAHNAASKVEDPEERAKVSKDIEALRALADTAGDPVTPYGGSSPAPLPPLPPLRAVHHWAREGDPVSTARVVVDGYRTLVNGTYRLALRGDRVTAPSDVIDLGVKRGVLRREEV